MTNSKTNIQSSRSKILDHTALKAFRNEGFFDFDLQFPELKGKIAVGLIGSGSECLGYDDEISKDHDYDIGFCMWLSDDDYKTMGDALQNEYENLIGRHFKEHDGLLKKRRGVFAINDFYNDILNTNCDYESGAEIDYENIDEHRLLNAINGPIFYDSCG